MKIGVCMIHLQKCSESAKSLHNAIEIFQLTCLDQETDEEIAIAFNKLGSVLVQICHYDDALIYLKRSLEIQCKILGSYFARF